MLLSLFYLFLRCLLLSVASLNYAWLKHEPFLHWPVERDGTETEHGGRAEEFMEELDGLAEYQSVKPPAAARAGSERNVEGDAHQAGADSWARQVLDEAVGHGFKDICAAGAPQDRGISCGEEERGAAF